MTDKLILEYWVHHDKLVDAETDEELIIQYNNIDIIILRRTQ